jgi:hypothetical protein
LDSELKRMDLEKAANDLRRRTLAGLPQPLVKFIYLASMRDYNSGLYYHDGLADQFSPEVACQALADCHRETFQQLVTSSMESLVAQLEAYIASSQSPPHDFVAVWKTLAPYRVAVPVAAEPFATEFLFSNLKVALAIVEERLTRSQQAPPVS